jgi:2-dehydro-3-deoxygluconokinase
MPAASFTRRRCAENLEILDRVGGGGLVRFGIDLRLVDRTRVRSGPVECGAAHGALAMTTPGDTTMATMAK